MLRTDFRINFVWPKRNKMSSKGNLVNILCNITVSRFKRVKSDEDHADIHHTEYRGIENITEGILPKERLYIPQWISQQTNIAISEKHSIRGKPGHAEV